MITYTTNQYGLRQKDMDFMRRLFEETMGVDKVILFGSRAMGNFELGSDVDLAVVGETITTKDIARIHFILEEDGPTPLAFDVVHLNTLKNEVLKTQIEASGKLIFERG